MEALTPAQIAAELADAVGQGASIAWVGSGLSKPLYPDWREALGHLCAGCGVADLGSSEAAPTAEQLINKAEECMQANVGAYEATLARLYGQPASLTRLAYLWLIKAPFKAFVTTNFDPLLSETARAAGYTDLRCYPLLPPPDIELRRKPVFYIHGHARPNGNPNGHRLVLARSEFSRAYGDRGVVRLFVQNLLAYYPIVFVGCGLSEPEIRQQFDRVHKMHIQIRDSRGDFTAPPRFALLPTISREIHEEGAVPVRQRDQEAEAGEERRFEELDTQVLRYHPADPRKQWEIEDILKVLCELTPEATRVGPGHGGPR